MALRVRSNPEFTPQMNYWNFRIISSCPSCFMCPRSLYLTVTRMPLEGMHGELLFQGPLAKTLDMRDFVDSFDITGRLEVWGTDSPVLFSQTHLYVYNRTVGSRLRSFFDPTLFGMNRCFPDFSATGVQQSKLPGGHSGNVPILRTGQSTTCGVVLGFALDCCYRNAGWDKDVHFWC